MFRHADALYAERLSNLDKVCLILENGIGIPFSVEQRLPLAYHAEYVVVDNNLDDRNVVSGKCCQLIHVHTETAVTCDVDDRFVRASHFCAHGCSKTESHRSKTAGGQKRSRARITVILRRPHLMLSDIRCDNCLSVRCLIDLLDHIRSGKPLFML